MTLKSRAISITVHVIAVALIAVFDGKVLTTPKSPDKQSVMLVAPFPPRPLRPRTIEPPKPPVVRRQFIAPTPVLSAPSIEPPAPIETPVVVRSSPTPVPAPVQPPPRVETFEPPKLAPVERPRPAITLDTFAGTDQSDGTGQRHVTRIDAVGFGDASVAGNQRRSIQIAGAGGTASAGFGDVVAARSTDSATRRAEQIQTTPVATPVEIQFKPRPIYTDEGRRLRIEGDVQISIAFTASGEVRVLKIMVGLGHGLDETAVTAARGIRFRPAAQDGKPVDMNAVVRIRFELAY